MEDDKGKAAKAQLLAKDAIKLAVYAESFGGPLLDDQIEMHLFHYPLGSRGITDSKNK